MYGGVYLIKMRFLVVRLDCSIKVSIFTFCFNHNCLSAVKTHRTLTRNFHSLPKMFIFILIQIFYIDLLVRLVFRSPQIVICTTPWRKLRCKLDVHRAFRRRLVLSTLILRPVCKRTISTLDQ